MASVYGVHAVVGVAVNGPSEVSTYKDDGTAGAVHLNGPSTGEPSLNDTDTNGYKCDTLSSDSKFSHSHDKELDDTNERSTKRRRIDSPEKDSPGSSEISQEIYSQGEV
ncbi:unnamed protein product [Ranitomeya imitator]|uniref:Uncharacterized protein n=1 Tax=Ranitomeya imitator TaxID=111125 RepID=A0ABN9KQY6_9NEOB|nr:unnamed protein product [Ranitomeya imitator]